MPIGSFFEEYDVSGKTIVPFCTNQGSVVDSGYDPAMVEWFVKMVEERKKNNRREKETKNC